MRRGTALAAGLAGALALGFLVASLHRATPSPDIANETTPARAAPTNESSGYVAIVRGCVAQCTPRGLLALARAERMPELVASDRALAYALLARWRALHDVAQSGVQRAALHTLQIELARADASGYARWLQSAQPTASAEEWDTFANALLPTHAAELARASSQITTPNVRVLLLRRALGAWLAGDVQAALAWYDALPPHDQAPLVATAARALAESAPALAMARFERAGGADRTTWANAIALSIGRRGEASAMAWADALPSAQRAAALESLVAGLAEVDPAAAVALAHTTNAGERVEVAAYARWTKERPDDALDHIDRIDDAKRRAFHLSTALTVWAARDATAAGAWALARPSGDERDRLLTALVFAHPFDTNAKSWVDAIESQRERDAAQAHLDALDALDSKVRTPDEPRFAR